MSRTGVGCKGGLGARGVSSTGVLGGQGRVEACSWRPGGPMLAWVGLGQPHLHTDLPRKGALVPPRVRVCYHFAADKKCLSLGLLVFQNWDQRAVACIVIIRTWGTGCAGGGGVWGTCAELPTRAVTFSKQAAFGPPPRTLSRT